jgi:hypothetical protein
VEAGGGGREARQEEESMTVDYVAAARRHIRDAHLLQHHGHRANAGQLFGICVECGLKSLLVRGGAPVDADGNLDWAYRKHMPQLDTLINGLTMLPDGRSASILQSRLPNLSSLAHWKIDHRYWSEAKIPLSTHLGDWELAALEMDALLDEAAGGGVL